MVGNAIKYNITTLLTVLAAGCNEYGAPHQGDDFPIPGAPVIPLLQTAERINDGSDALIRGTIVTPREIECGDEKLLIADIWVDEILNQHDELNIQADALLGNAIIYSEASAGYPNVRRILNRWKDVQGAFAIGVYGPGNDPRRCPDGTEIYSYYYLDAYTLSESNGPSNGIDFWDPIEPGWFSEADLAKIIACLENNERPNECTAMIDFFTTCVNRDIPKDTVPCE